MLTLLRDLVAHKGFATAALLGAMQQSRTAMDDDAMRQLLEHVRVSNRFWLLTILGQPFAVEHEGRASGSFAELVARFETLQREEEAWLAQATPDDLGRVLAGPLIPSGRCTVGDALLQIALHSQGHRSQCATLLRRSGGTPPVTDFIVWIGGRVAAVWPDTPPA